MKIEKVHIKNVKGIKDLELSLKKDDKILDLIVLAGVNGSGKTTILEAIKDFFNNKNINFGDIEKSNVNLKILKEKKSFHLLILTLKIISIKFFIC